MFGTLSVTFTTTSWGGNSWTTACCKNTRETAFADEGRGWIVGAKAAAIRCLARFDGCAAFLAAKTALRNPSCHDRHFYPYILIELDSPVSSPLDHQCLSLLSVGPVGIEPTSSGLRDRCITLSATVPNQSAWWESNPRPASYKDAALTAVLNRL